MTNAKLTALMARGTQFLGCDTAILCGAMSWVSERHLVAAISNAGGFGVIACGAMTPALLDAEIAATKALTAKPFGVNLITMHPQLFDLIDVCARHDVTHVVLAGGLPPKGSIEAIKAKGAKLICFAPLWRWPRNWPAPASMRWWWRAMKRAAISARLRPACWRRKSCPK